MEKATKQEPADGATPRFPLQTAAGPLGTAGSDAWDDMARGADERRDDCEEGRRG